jgi:tRNA(fMet)-specific endonuclease VapC
MNGEYLLDTNIVIALFAGEPGVQASISGAEEVFLSSIVLGELYFGAVNSSRPQANTEALEVFAKTCTEVPVDSHTAKVYAATRLKLKKRGRPIPENDIWLAACALQHGMVLVTRDRHFESIDAIEIVEW